MPGLPPIQAAPEVAHKAAFPDASSLQRLDAVLVLLPTTARPAGNLPAASRWQRLHQRDKPAHARARTAALDNAKETLLALGYCRENPDSFELLRAAGVLVQKALAERPRARRIAVIAQLPARERARWQEALCAALLAQLFELPSSKSGPAKVAVRRRIEVCGESTLPLRRVRATAEANNLVRYLVALPPDQLDARGYRQLLARLARRHNLRLRWHDERALAKAGAGAFLAVCRGNARRDAGIAQLTYTPARTRGKATAPPDVALVGKGILFDTGGTNLKPHRSMLDMHTDMAGSAVAVATLCALATLKAPFSVDTWLAISENSIGPSAYRPQEIVRAANGTTIQVIHTDAEGRMVLADTLALAARRKPRLLIDFATLTGACVHALTERMSGVFANDEALLEAAVAAGRASGERLWPFPMPEDFDTDIESSVADVAQCAVDGKGDHILATRFLRRFVPETVRWAHIDLSSATRRGGLAHVTTEITGFGVRATLALLLDQKLAR